MPAMTYRAILAGLLFLPLVAPLAAKAQTRTEIAQYCAQLEGELAKLQRAKSARSSRNFAKYDAAIHKQLAQLDSANRRAKRDGCFGGRGFLFRRTPKATCPALLKRIDKMKRNLATLEKKRSKYTPAPSDRAQAKADILRKLGSTGCGQQYDRFARAKPSKPRRRGLFSKIFKPRSNPGVREYNDQFYNVPEVATYRTVCVRSCDGFFFPVSFSTTESNFVRDDGVCQSSCPGTQVELFVYKNPGQTPEEMVSLTGRPYQSLQTAFLFQKQYVKNCSCQAPRSQLVSLTTSDQPLPLSTPARTARSSGPTVPLPLPKQSAMIDPDTLASERFGLTFTPYRPPEVSSKKGVVQTADGRSIRIVGPKFFGSQE